MIDSQLRTEVQMDTVSSQPPESTFSWKRLTLFLSMLCAVLACLLMIQPFLPAISGAVVLAIVTQRPHNWIAARLRNPTLAASTSLMLVTLSIIVPASLLGQSFGRHIMTFVHAIQNGTPQRGLQSFLGQSPRAAAILQYFLDNISLNQTIEKSAGFIGGKLAAAFGGSITVLTQLIIMLFLLFFLYRDKEMGLSSLRSILPLNDAESDYLLLRIYHTVRATVLGRFAVAAIQGMVAGITFAALGIPAASLLGFLTMLFAIVPTFGAFVVWFPAAVYLAATHHWIQAIILVIVGTFIISTLDNVLYPVLVGTQLRLHTVPVFLSVLGGIWFYGVIGIVVGPIVFTLAESLLKIWRQSVVPELSSIDTSVP